MEDWRFAGTRFKWLSQLIISNSDRATFKNCRLKWDFNSPNRQNLRPKRKQKALWLGSLAHECLEHFYSGRFRDTYHAFRVFSKEIPEDEKLEYAEELVLLETMMIHYSLVYPNLEVEPFESISLELPFQIPLNDKGDMFAGTIDGVVRCKTTGNIQILEHKTFSMHKDTELHDIDDQTSIYPAALNMLIKQGKVPGTTPLDFCQTVIYNGLWKKKPTELKILKNGSISKMSFSNTTEQWLEYSTKQMGKDPKKALDKLEDISHNVGKFFPRWYIHRGEKEQKLAVNRLLAEFREMSNPDVVLYHNPTTECTWKCGFTQLCGKVLCGADTDELIRELYEKSPSRGDAYEKKGE